MARSAGEVKTDIALTRQGIQRDLEALHRHVPKRSWLSYAWLAGGLAVGMGLSRVPVLAVVSQGLRMIQFAATLMGIVAMFEPILAEVRAGRHASASADDHPGPRPRRAITQEGSDDGAPRQGNGHWR